ncbi:ABC transporter substrate-binding protein [Antribacter gilvus]|uniref:ABC transporter substrate-binding protein n=1 Tax=Antribacter gilvus TaxID=2304675 RepID=UPI000F76A0FB|nr:ABC transporter substrate-binding protein [Antribacter gilvus]
MIRRRARGRLLLAAALTSATLLAGCSGTGEEQDGAAAPTLNVWAGSQTPITANFNPFAPTVLHGALGPVYETLFLYNKAGGGDPVPMLGETFEWNEDGTVLTVTVRQGVEWSDGEAFTVDDVVYSFTNEITKSTYLESAEATDDTTVVLTYSEPQFTNEFAILGGAWMLPEHVWSEKSVEEATTWANETPVGTGPYTVDTVSEASYTLVANESYWQEGKPAVKSVRYLGIDANASAEDLLKSGDLDWAAMFVPDPEGIAAAGGPAGYVNTPQDPTVLYTCANAELGCAGPQTDVAVRQALNLALDRGTINEKAFVGLTGTISPTFALLGRDDQWIAPDVDKQSPQAADVDAATAVLEAAGYAKGADGIYAKDGAPVELELVSVEGWTDYNDAAKLIEEQAAAAGIKVTATTVTWQEFSDNRQSGNFQLIMGGVIGTSMADPFQIYRDWFSGEYTQPVGTQLEAGEWNFTRYSNPVVDAAVATAAAASDEQAKMAAYTEIQHEISRDLPYIPLVINATQTFYNDAEFTGWPTEDDLYAFPPSWGAVSAGYILANLEPVE